MARIIGVKCPSAPALQIDKQKGIDQHFPNLTSCAVAVDVITPIFGGGAQPGENDPISVVRAASVRGHLRFWWRATRGLSFATAAELRTAEAAVWGAASSPSPVIVEVAVRDQGHTVNAGDLRREFDLAYALFPFQENRGGRDQKPQPAREGREGVRFVLTLRFPPRLYADAWTALWAWTNFGGVGARTRRGLGALRCQHFLPRAVDRDGRWFANEWENLRKLPRSAPRPWPVLGDPPLVSNVLPDARQAWARALHQLREFRQGYGVGRRGYGSTPGRSFWPEADSLRIITNRGDGRHMDSLTVDEPAFPRAALGMPIVMHFKGREDSPNNCTVEPSEPGLETTRMSSPIILRPLAVAGDKYVAIVLRLSAQKPATVAVKFQRDQKSGPHDVERPDLAEYSGSPMKGTEGSAVGAFMRYARKNL